MYKLLRYFLFLLPPERAHAFVCSCLKIFSLFKLNFYTDISNKPVTFNNITFKNSIGIAAGFDKSATMISAMESLGIGFMEVGTFTPKAQIGNPKPRLFRLVSYEALINRMGFNNVGIENGIKNIKAQNFSIPIGISIAKNNETPHEDALIDYLFCLEKAYNHCNFITLNVSCPNVPNPDHFWAEDSMAKILCAVKEKQLILAEENKHYVPVFVKIGPDLIAEDIKKFAYIMNESGLDGVIACNTSRARSKNLIHKFANEKGGLSGKPIFKLSLNTIKQLKQELKPTVTLIGLGGIDSPQSAKAYFDAGADLIQVYTGLVYKGPGLINRILRVLK